MDIKGQKLCENLFEWVMWRATVISFLVGMLTDDVEIIFKTFGVSLGLSAVLCLPNWPMYNKNPIAFVPETGASQSTTSTSRSISSSSKSTTSARWWLLREMDFVMDLKGQRRCENLFLWIMWRATAIAFLAGILTDDVVTVFKVFGMNLGLSAVLCLPNWPMYNKNPIDFVSETQVSENTTSTAKTEKKSISYQHNLDSSN